MRIMVIGLRGFPAVQGGVEKHAEQLYPLLIRLGCEVHVIVRSLYVRADVDTWRGVCFHRLWAPRVKGLEAFVHSLLGVLYAGLKRPDILHVHAIGPALMVPLARLLGLRVVVTHHGPDYEREKWGKVAKWMLRLGEHWGMRFASERIVISEGIRKLVQQEYHRDAVVIPNGVTLPRIPASKKALQRFSLDSRHYVLLVGRLVPEKRHLDLIQAFAQAKLPGWKLVLVGGADNLDRYCRKVLPAANKTPGVVFTGVQSGLALQELYANAGIFVLPSSYEGLPIALLEALSYGIPVLASNIPANLEVGLPGEQYFPLGDISALANLLRTFAKTGFDYDRLPERQSWINERYNWKRIAERTLVVYNSVAQR